MIEKLTDNTWSTIENDPLPLREPPTNEQIKAKINEIIEELNKQEQARITTPNSNGHYPGSCLSCTATHP